MIRLYTVLIAAIAVLTIAPLAMAAPQVLAPGRWEVTIKTILPDATPTSTTEICISKAEAERPEPPKGKPDDDCLVVGALNGNVLKYQVKCGRKKTTSDVEFTYEGDRYAAVIVFTSEDGEVRQIHTAKRIGDCVSP